MGALVQHDALLPVLDTTSRWQRDLTALCAIAGASACAWALPVAPALACALACAGGLSGALIGGLSGRPMRWALDQMRRRRLPLWAVAVVVPALSAALAVVVGELGLLLALPVLGPPSSPWAFYAAAVQIFAPVGAMLGALLWLPYAMTVVLRQARWPVLAATAFLTPVLTLGWLWGAVYV